MHGMSDLLTLRHAHRDRPDVSYVISIIGLCFQSHFIVYSSLVKFDYIMNRLVHCCKRASVFLYLKALLATILILNYTTCNKHAYLIITLLKKPVAIYKAAYLTSFEKSFTSVLIHSKCQ